jgi:flagellar basal-body rod modification protein FlgD
MSVSSAMPATSVPLPSSDQIPSSATGSSANSTLTEANFLTLLTTQLENQNPLNPMSSSDFAAELAQFSTASGVAGIQTSLTGIASQITTAGGVQASNLVGHNVAVTGNSLLLGSTGSAYGAFTLPAAASDAVVTVADTTGKTIAKLDLGALGTGAQSFSWNGEDSDGSTVAPGNYQFSVAAVNSAGVAMTATTSTVAQVTGVAFGGTNGPVVDLNGGLAPVALSAVQQIY